MTRRSPYLLLGPAVKLRERTASLRSSTTRSWPFARALIRALGHAGAVPSPTYTLVEPYDLPRGMVYHVDLYRVSSEDELRYLGWTELDAGFRIVEWPDRAPGISNAADLRIEFEYADQGRWAAVAALSPQGARISARLEADTVTDPID